MDKIDKFNLILSFILGVIGTILVISYSNWELCLGMYLMLWGNNLSQSKKDDNE